MSISNNKTFYSYLFIYSWLMPVYKLYCWAAHSIPSKDPKEEGYRSGLAHHETQDAWGFEKRLVCSNNSSRAALHCFSKIQTWASGLDIDDCYQSGPPPCRLSVGAGSPRKSGCLGLRKASGVQQQLITSRVALFFKNTNMGFGSRYRWLLPGRTPAMPPIGRGWLTKKIRMTGASKSIWCAATAHLAPWCIVLQKYKHGLWASIYRWLLPGRTPAMPPIGRGWLTKKIRMFEGHASKSVWVMVEPFVLKSHGLSMSLFRTPSNNRYGTIDYR